VIERLAHSLDGGSICLVLLAMPHPPGRCDRRRLGYADQFERQVAVAQAFGLTAGLYAAQLALLF
jgi:hypothetical protein